MGWLTRTRHRLASAIAGEEKTLPFSMGTGTRVEDMASTIRWIQGGSPEQTEVMTQPYRQHATVATAIQTIAEDASSIEWEVFPRGNYEDPIDDHPVHELFAKPNGLMHGSMLWTALYTMHESMGECFWYFPDMPRATQGAARNGLDRALSALDRGTIDLLPPSDVEYEVVNGELIWYWKRTQGQRDRIDPAEMTLFKRFNPYNMVRGLSKIDAVMADIQGDYHAAQWNKRFFFDQNGVPTLVLLPPIEEETMTKDQRSEIDRSWNSRHGRRRNAGVLYPGWDVKDLTVSQRDMDFTALRQYSREQILAMFGVPPFRAGVLDKANYANSRQQDEVYWNGTIHRLIMAVAATLNADFLPKIGLGDIEMFPRWEVVKGKLEDLDEKTSVAERWFKMGLSKKVLNERLDLGWNPDDIEDYEVSYLPAGILPADADTRAALASGGAVSGEGDDGDDDEDGNEDEERGLAPRRVSRHAESPEERELRRAARWKTLILRVRDLEQTVERKMRSHFKNIEDEVLENLGGAKGWVAVHTKAKDPDRLMFDRETSDKNLRRALKPHHREAAKRGGETLFTDVGLAIAFDMAQPDVITHLAGLSKKVVGINGRVYKRLKSSLMIGLAEGETERDLAERIRGIMGASRSRARTIARTEVGFAYSGARNIAMQRAGFKRHEWLSSRDPAVRESHVEEDGNAVKIGDPFPVTGVKYPLDPSGPAEEVINCRCLAEPVLS